MALLGAYLEQYLAALHLPHRSIDGLVTPQQLHT